MASAIGLVRVVSHCKLIPDLVGSVTMRFVLFLSAVFAGVGWALPDAKANIQEFGPWRIGMSKGEAASFREYGPYEYNQSATSEFQYSARKFDLLGEKVGAVLRFQNDKIVAIYVNLGKSDEPEEVVAMLRKAARYLRGELGSADPDDHLQSPDRVTHVENMRMNGRWFYGLPGFTYLKVGVLRRGPSEWSMDIFIGAKEAGVPSAPDDSNDSPAPDSTETFLQEWSMQVPGGEGKFKRRLASIHALLVKPIGSGGNAAQAMKLSATAVPGVGSQIQFSFNQPVGSDMSRASEEVVRAIQVKHGELPGGMDVEFGFADKWGGKDGPSAAVATALLLESLLGGFEIPTALAVTGDLNADQTVQPVGGVADKIRGAMAKDCLWIGVPAANEEDLNDLVVEENLRRFLTAKVFTLRKLDDAVVLANVDGRNPAFAKAVEEFDAIQKDLAKSGAKALYSPQLQTRLSAIFEVVPNFYSAKVLLAASQRKAPSRYSLAGTLVRINEAMAPFAQTIDELQAGESIEKFQFGRNNPMSETRKRLTDLKQKSDPRLVDIIGAQLILIDRTQSLINSNTKSSTVLEKQLSELSIAGDRADAQWQKLISNQKIQDQLMKRGIYFE